MPIVFYTFSKVVLSYFLNVPCSSTCYLSYTVCTWSCTRSIIYNLKLYLPWCAHSSCTVDGIHIHNYSMRDMDSHIVLNNDCPFIIHVLFTRYLFFNGTISNVCYVHTIVPWLPSLPLSYFIELILNLLIHLIFA